MRHLSLSRSFASLLLLGGSLAPLVALETPLVMNAGSNTAILDPGLGTITTFEFRNNGSTRKGFCNWLADLERLERTVIGVRNDETFTALRTGSPVVKPVPEDFIKMFPKEPTKKQAEAGQKGLQVQVREAEKAFWEKPVPYDGIVRGAVTSTYTMLVIPSKRVALFYQSTGKENVEIMGFTNYSPVLYVQTAWKSTPDPAEFIRQLNLDAEDMKAIEGALAARADGGAPQAAKSEIWCTSIGAAFILIDSANDKIWSYEVNSQNSVLLTSVRSMSVDLLAPGYRTAPLDQVAVDAFSKAYTAQLRSLGIEKLDEPYVKALLAAFRVGDSAKAGALQANTTGDTVVLNFTAQNKILAYAYRAGAGLELSTVRDEAVDQGLTLIAKLAQEKVDARKYYTEALAQAAKHNTAQCLSYLSQALTYDPILHKEAEKSSALRSELKADWDKLMADATQAEVALLTKRENVAKAAQAERERLAKKRSGGR